MAEFEINLGDTTVSIDDDGLYDAIEHKVDQSVEDYISNNLDVHDDVYQIIWDFNRWDEIISSNMQYISVNDLDDGQSLIREEDLASAVESMLYDFIRVTRLSRCGVGKAFAEAVEKVIMEVVPEMISESQSEAAVMGDLNETVERITRFNVKLAAQSAVDSLDNIWPSSGQSESMKFDRQLDEAIEEAISNGG